MFNLCIIHQAFDYVFVKLFPHHFGAETRESFVNPVTKW